jgi:hypothetical protein
MKDFKLIDLLYKKKKINLATSGLNESTIKFVDKKQTEDRKLKRRSRMRAIILYYKLMNNRQGGNYLSPACLQILH